MIRRVRTRSATPAAPPRIEGDPSIVASYLSDAAHVPGGFAPGVVVPANEAEAAAAIAAADAVLAVGAQSSLTGGATPRGELVLSTRALAGIAPVDGQRVRVGAGVPLAHLQAWLSAHDLYYPPVPTYDGAFVGGTIATNAAGAATFKYGATRAWVEAMTVILADGAVLEISRGEACAAPDGTFAIEMPGRGSIGIEVPAYRMPPVPKLSAGYYAAPGMDLIDLFIGSEGTLGVVTAAILRVIPRPRRAMVLVECRGDAEAMRATAEFRRQATLAWAGGDGLDVSAIEYMDARSLHLVPDDALARAGVVRPPAGAVLLLVQFEAGPDEDAAWHACAALLDACGVTADPVLAAAGEERAAQRLFELREAVPAAVNARIAAAKQGDPRIEKTAGDFIVPFGRLADSIALYRHELEARGLDYAVWGHASDGNLHVNVVPRTLADVTTGREALIAIARRVIEMGGSPLAEHGVGRSAMKQRLLRLLYGDAGVAQMRRVKQALDPGWKLAPGVLFPAGDVS